MIGSRVSLVSVNLVDDTSCDQGSLRKGVRRGIKKRGGREGEAGKGGANKYQ